MNGYRPVAGKRVVKTRARAVAILSLVFVLFPFPSVNQPPAGQAAPRATWNVQTVDYAGPVFLPLVRR